MVVPTWLFIAVPLLGLFVPAPTAFLLFVFTGMAAAMVNILPVVVVIAFAMIGYGIRRLVQPPSNMPSSHAPAE